METKKQKQKQKQKTNKQTRKTKRSVALQLITKRGAMSSPSLPSTSALQSEITALKKEVKSQSRQIAHYKYLLQRLSSQTEFESERYVNQLLKTLKSEKEARAYAVGSIENEEEEIVNNLLRKMRKLEVENIELREGRGEETHVKGERRRENDGNPD